jgi:hypothetical protein
VGAWRLAHDGTKLGARGTTPARVSGVSLHRHTACLARTEADLRPEDQLFEAAEAREAGVNVRRSNQLQYRVVQVEPASSHPPLTRCRKVYR